MKNTKNTNRRAERHSRKGVSMTDATLRRFRAIAASMTTEPIDWQWIGPHMSQRMFGITEQRAKDYAERHGGEARKMDE